MQLLQAVQGVPQSWAPREMQMRLVPLAARLWATTLDRYPAKMDRGGRSNSTRCLKVLLLDGFHCDLLETLVIASSCPTCGAESRL